jgi:hypothetical protein
LELKATLPVTATPPGAWTVKVAVVIDAALIGTLNVALIVALMATFVAPGTGVTETTPGMLTVSTPHPATKTTNKVARKYMNPKLYLRILYPHVQLWWQVGQHTDLIVGISV